MTIEYLFAWMAVLLRSVGVIMQLPVVAGRPIPIPVRVAIGICLATLLAGIVPVAPVPAAAWGLVVAAAMEVLLGLALVLFGFNLGYITGGPLAAWLITQLGWRAAYGVLGAGCGLLTACAAFTVRLPRPAERAALDRSHPARTGNAPTALSGSTLGESLRDPRQWALNFSWLLLGGLALMISVHAVPFARDQGVSLAGASLALTAYGVGSVIGRLCAGMVSDRLGTRVTIGAAYVLEMAALLALLWIPTRGALLGSLVAFGAGFAASDTMVAKMIPEVFGLRAIAAIMGILTLGWRLGAAVGPALAGFLYDAAGSYRIPFGAAPLAVLLSWGLFALGTATRRR